MSVQSGIIMAERRKQARVDLAAWLLLFSGLGVAVCVLSHEPLAGERVSLHAPNLLGKPGEWLARELYATLGSAVYVLLASWFVLVLMLLVRRSWKRWSCRFAGWLLLLPCSAIAADWLGPDWLQGPLYGSGGTLGASLHALLHRHLPGVRGGLALSAVALVGFLLAGNFLLRWLLDGVLYCCVGLSWTVATLGAAISAPFRAPFRWLFGPRAEALEVAELAEPASADGIPISRSLNGWPADAEPAAAAPGETPAPADPVDPAKTNSLEIKRMHAPPMEEAQSFENYELPPLTLLDDPQPFPYEQHDEKLREQAILLEKTFQDFGLNVHVVGINTGPVITQYEVALETGMRVNKITTLADDLALHLKVPSVRIVAPIPGKNAVGIEVPNEHRAVVRLKEVILGAGRKLAKCKIPVFLGKDSEGKPLTNDLADLPHLLIAGTTGTGKSVCLNTLIISMLMTRRPDELKLLLVDPKKNEFSEYRKIPHLLHPVITQEEKATAVLAWLVDKMEERYDLLSRARVRNIAAYNELGIAEIHRRVQPEGDEVEKLVPKLPYIVIVIDEFGDLIMTTKREAETYIIRLAQKARAAGIHLVLATQRPTVDIVTGLIKSNLPGRICFKVASRLDSRVVLDEMGADKLLGKGDMLFLQPGINSLIRAQGTYASEEELARIVKHLECDTPCFSQELLQLKSTKEMEGASPDKSRERDPLYEQAIAVVVREGRGSTSLLQRALGIGYGRASRLIDFMAEDGIVGPFNGSSAREVLFSPEEWAAMKQTGEAATVSGS